MSASNHILFGCFIVSHCVAEFPCLLVQAFIVERYNRPLPKLRTSKAAGHDEQKPTPPGSLNTAQLRHILLLHQGKADDHDGAMDTHHIAEKFKIDVIEVERILQFISLPTEETDKKATDDSR